MRMFRPGVEPDQEEREMGVAQIVLFVAIAAVVGGYWWFKFGRDGAKGYYKKLFGLRDGEQIRAMWICYYDIDRSLGEKVGEVLGMHTRGLNVMAATTDMNRLVFGNTEGHNQPLGFEKGRVSVSLTDRKAEMKTLAGPTGQMENAVVMLVEPRDGSQPFRLQIPQSGFDALSAWTAQA